MEFATKLSDVPLGSIITIKKDTIYKYRKSMYVEIGEEYKTDKFDKDEYRFVIVLNDSDTIIAIEDEGSLVVSLPGNEFYDVLDFTIEESSIEQTIENWKYNAKKFYWILLAENSGKGSEYLEMIDDIYEAVSKSKVLS